MKNDDQYVLEQRKKCRQFVKDSILLQMKDLTTWGILTDFRYSYLTMSKFSFLLKRLKPSFSACL